MKKVSLLIAMIAFFMGSTFAQSMYFDFEGQTAGNKIAQTLGEPWTTWSNTPGSAEDGVFGEAGGSMAAHFTYGNDQVLRLGGIESGVFDLVFDAYVPNGKCGYFNVLHNFAGSGSTWAAQFYLCATNDGSTSSTTVLEGHGTVHAGSNGTADIPCVWDQWMQYRVHIDMDNDVATLFFNVAGEPEVEYCTWQWSLDSFGNNVVGRTLDAMDFYPPSNGAEYYVDNIGIIDGGDDQVLIDDNFEAYTVGNKIAVEAQAAGNDWWTTWSNNPGSNEDGVVADYDGSKCGHLTYNNDQVLLLGGVESGTYDLEFDILVPNGKNGYFNILHEFNGSGSTWAMQAYLHETNDGQSSTQAPGHGTIHAGSNGTADIPCVYDEWMHFRLHVDTDLDVAEFFYSSETTYPEEQSLCTWQWSLDSFGENVVGRKLDAMDFFPPTNAATSEYYLDNFKFTRIGQESAASLDFDTDEIAFWIEEDDMLSTEIEISNVGTSIGDWTAWVDFGETTGGTQTTQINYDAEPGTASSLVGLNIDAPELVEVGAMFPGAAYAGSAMGTKVLSAQYVFFTNSETGTIGIEGNTSVTFRLYAQGMYGQPGEVLAEKTVPYSAIVADDWTIATFDTPVAITGYNVWVTVEFTQAVSGYAMSFDGGTPSEYGDFYRTNGGGAFSRCSEVFSTVYGNFHIRINSQGMPVPATWASLSKPEGTIMIGGTDEVTVNVNSIGYSVGDEMEANIMFLTNDPENPIVIIPLLMIVDPDGVIENAASAFNVYPNPTTGMVNIEGENISSIAIYNAAGQLVNVVRGTTTIDMSVYGSGVFYLNIIDNANNSTVQSVIVK